MSTTGTNRHPEARLSGRERLWAGLLGLVLLAPLVVAGLLTPNPEGRGTHQQLGLPPCTFVVMFGIPCPSCGMTTAWAHMVRGQVIGALRANVGGAILAAMDLVAVPWLVISAVRGRWLVRAPTSVFGVWLMAAVLVVTLVDWAVRLYRL